MRKCVVCSGQDIEEVVQDNKRYYYCVSCKKLYGRVIDSRYGRDITIETDSGIKHLSVGALIKKDGTFLLLKRRNWPYGYGLPSGHVEYQETPEEALDREVLEETALEVKTKKLIFQGEIAEKCRYGADIHIWYLYECTVAGGVPVTNSEGQTLNWFTLEEALTLDLVPAAQILLSRINTKVK